MNEAEKGHSGKRLSYKKKIYGLLALLFTYFVKAQGCGYNLASFIRYEYKELF